MKFYFWPKSRIIWNSKYSTKQYTNRKNKQVQSANVTQWYGISKYELRLSEQ